MKYLLHSYTFSLLFFALIKLCASKDCLITDNIEVHVINRLPTPKLKLHCASGDTELGYHYTETNYDYHWNFCDRWDGRTLFFCHFWWGQKDASFDVFQSKIKEKCNGKKGPFKCTWEVRTDGIYFNGAREPGKFKRVQAW